MGIHLNHLLERFSPINGFEKLLEEILVPEVGFEPTKHFAAHLECAPFDHSGTPALVGRRVHQTSFFLIEIILIIPSIVGDK